MKPSYSLLATVLLLAVHLLGAYYLIGAILGLLAQGPENQRFDLAWKGAGLALLLLFWVGALLVWRLWQRRWLVAGALAVLLVVDGLAFCGGVLLTGVIGVTADVPPE
jgi:hypothetical protein